MYPMTDSLGGSADLFPSDSVIRRVSLEPAVFLGAGRALLLQLAHPVVAQGVADHSEFKRNPFKRLQGTLEATMSVVVGTRDLADGIGRRIRWIHDHIVGPDYRANDPENLLWVHATLVDTALVCYERYVGPLTPAEREAYYEQNKTVAEVFGVPRSAQPATLGDFDDYFRRTVSSLEVTETGRDLIGFILDPELPFGLHRSTAPLLALLRAVTLELTPPAVVAQLGIAPDPGRRRTVAAFDAVAAGLARVTPRPLRVAPTVGAGALFARAARRRVHDFERQVPTGAVGARLADHGMDD